MISLELIGFPTPSGYWSRRTMTACGVAPIGVTQDLCERRDHHSLIRLDTYDIAPGLEVFDSARRFFR
jgi:hypothetical protein